MDEEANMLLSRSCIALSKLSWLMYEATKTYNVERKACLEKFIAEFKKSVDATRDLHVMSNEDLELCSRLEITPLNLPDLFVSLYWYEELKKLYEERDPSVCIIYSHDHDVSATIVSPGLDKGDNDRNSALWQQSPWKARITDCVEADTMTIASIETGQSSTKRQFLSKSFKTTFEKDRHRLQQSSAWNNDPKLNRLAPVVKLERLSHSEIVLLSGKPASAPISSNSSSPNSSTSAKRARKG